MELPIIFCRAIIAALLKHAGLLADAKEFARNVQEQLTLGQYGSPSALKIPPSLKNNVELISRRFRNWMLQQRQMFNSGEINKVGKM